MINPLPLRHLLPPTRPLFISRRAATSREALVVKLPVASICPRAYAGFAYQAPLSLVFHLDHLCYCGGQSCSDSRNPSIRTLRWSAPDARAEWGQRSRVSRPHASWQSTPPLTNGHRMSAKMASRSPDRFVVTWCVVDAGQRRLDWLMGSEGRELATVVMIYIAIERLDSVMDHRALHVFTITTPTITLQQNPSIPSATNGPIIHCKYVNNLQSKSKEV